MKQALFTLSFFFLAFAFPAKGTTYIIEAYNYYFTPDTLDVMVGDTIQWNWIEGNHTTTSNGIPDSAAVWNVLLDEYHPVFVYVATAPGEYEYISVPDAPGMNGSFTVMGTSGIPTLASDYISLQILTNPVHDQLSIVFSLSNAAHTEVALYDVLGRKREVLEEKFLLSGNYNELITLKNEYPPGFYFVNLKTETSSVTKKIVIQ